MTGPKKPTGMPGRGRQDRRIRELDHDPYHSKKKYSEPTVCPDCGVIYHEGRWQWGEAPEAAERSRCPACQRIHDRVPAGFLTLSGPFLAEHQDEILKLARNVEEHERTEHPLKRIMGVEEQPDALVLTFTDPHLARGAGEAVRKAYEGNLEVQYSEDEYLVRVYWER